MQQQILNTIGSKKLQEILKNTTEGKLKNYVAEILNEVETGRLNLSYEDCNLILRFLDQELMSGDSIQSEANISYRTYRQIKHKIRRIIKDGAFSRLDFEIYMEQEKLKL